MNLKLSIIIKNFIISLLSKSMNKLKLSLFFVSILFSVYVMRSFNETNSKIPRLLSSSIKNRYCSLVSEDSKPTTSDQNTAADLRQEFFNNFGNGENKLKVAINDSNWAEYVKSLVMPTIVWLIFLGFSIIGWLCYCVCCCCDKKCPPCKFLRRDVDVKPYQGFELWGVVLFLSIFGIAILGLSTAGIIYSTQVQSGTENAVCQLVTIYDEIVHGTTFNSTTWLGVSPVIDRITVIISELARFKTKFDNSLSDPTWIDSGSSNLLMENRNIYNRYKSSYLQTPNPNTTGGAVSSNFITYV